MTKEELADELERLALIARDLATATGQRADILVMNCLCIASLATDCLSASETDWLLNELTRLASRLTSESN